MNFFLSAVYMIECIWECMYVGVLPAVIRSIQFHKPLALSRNFTVCLKYIPRWSGTSVSYIVCLDSISFICYFCTRLNDLWWWTWSVLVPTGLFNFCLFYEHALHILWFVVNLKHLLNNFMNCLFMILVCCTVKIYFWNLPVDVLFIFCSKWPVSGDIATILQLLYVDWPVPSIDIPIFHFHIFVILMYLSSSLLSYCHWCGV